jgi:hypothetical protein
VGIFALYIFRIAFFAVRANWARRAYFFNAHLKGCGHVRKSVETVDGVKFFEIVILFIRLIYFDFMECIFYLNQAEQINKITYETKSYS